MTEAAARRLTLVATVLGSSLAFIDATVVNVALPAIQRDLDLGLTGQEWVYLAYSLALASLYLAAAVVAALGPEIDDPVGGLDDVHVVLDDHHGIALIHQPVQHLEQPPDVGEVQARGRLVQDV